MSFLLHYTVSLLLNASMVVMMMMMMMMMMELGSDYSPSERDPTKTKSAKKFFVTTKFFEKNC